MLKPRMALELPLLPEASPEDVEDVVWGLQTATALWNRGEKREALVWIRRAAEAAGSAGQDTRAVELARCAADLEQLFSASTQPQPQPQLHAFPTTRPDASEEPFRVLPAPMPAPHSPRSTGRIVPPGRGAMIEDEETGELADDLLEEETNDLRVLPGALRKDVHASVPRPPVSDTTMRSAVQATPLHSTPQSTIPQAPPPAAPPPSIPQAPRTPPHATPPHATPPQSMPHAPAPTSIAQPRAHATPPSSIPHAAPHAPPPASMPHATPPMSMPHAPPPTSMPHAPPPTSMPHASPSSIPHAPPVPIPPPSFGQPPPAVHEPPPPPVNLHQTQPMPVVQIPADPSPPHAHSVSERALVTPQSASQPALPVASLDAAPLVAPPIATPPAAPSSPAATSLSSPSVVTSAPLAPSVSAAQATIDGLLQEATSDSSTRSHAQLAESGLNPTAAAAAAKAIQLKKRSRAPILDPWSDDIPESESAPRTLHLRGMDHVPSDDEDIVTSAPPLETSLRRKPPPPPPKRTTTLTGSAEGADGTVRVDGPQSMASPAPTPAAETRPDGAAKVPLPPGGRKPTLVPRPASGPASVVSIPAAAGVPTPESGAQERPASTPDAPRERKSIPPPPPPRPTSDTGPVSVRRSVPPPPPAASAPAAPAPAPTVPGVSAEAAPRERAATVEVKSEPPPPTMPAAKVQRDRGSVPPPPSVRPPSSVRPPPPAPTLPTAPAVAAPAAVEPPAPVTPTPSKAREPAKTLEMQTVIAPPNTPEPSKVVLFGDSPEPAPKTTAPAPASPPFSATAPKPETKHPSVSPKSEARAADELGLDRIEAFADLPDELQRSLSEAARIVELKLEDEVPVTGAAMILAGSAAVCAAVADGAAAQVTQPTLVPALSSTDDATKIRLVATDTTRVATWERSTLEEILKSCPWVLDELVTLGDRYAALAGATMGPLGDLDEFSRLAALDRLKLKALHPNDVLAPAGGELQGLTIVGAGLVVIDRPSGAIEYTAGDIVMPDTVLEGGTTDAPIRAGAQGALVLHASRMVTVELFSILPSLIELLRVA
ncbi:MAG: hypothetical protein HOW73_48700 [Polyangiaceae bacterium]|nr:hypothetical protein [Polyangiaceae bacterium]